MTNIVEILKKKIKDNVEVKLIVDAHFYWTMRDRKKIFEDFPIENIKYAGHANLFGYDSIQHMKIIICDNVTILGGFNFSESYFGSSAYYNDSVYIMPKKYLLTFKKIFNNLWNDIQDKPEYSKTKTYVSLPHSQKNKCTFQKNICNLIKKAKKEITMYSNFFHLMSEEYDIISDAMDRGVKINVYTNDNYSNYLGVIGSILESCGLYDRINCLVKKGLNIYFSNVKKKYIHTKMLLIDNELIVIGTFNFSKKSIRNDREYFVVLTKNDFDEAEIKKLKSHYSKITKKYKGYNYWTPIIIREFMQDIISFIV